MIIKRKNYIILVPNMKNQMNIKCLTNHKEILNSNVSISFVDRKSKSSVSIKFLHECALRYSMPKITLLDRHTHTQNQRDSIPDARIFVFTYFHLTDASDLEMIVFMQILEIIKNKNKSSSHMCIIIHKPLWKRINICYSVFFIRLYVCLCWFIILLL